MAPSRHEGPADWEVNLIVQAVALSRVPETRDRALRIDGLTNARDLGGLRRLDGGTIPRGVFFRSENVDWIQPAGWDKVRAAGIRTVVDLRQPGERARDSSSRPSWITTVAVDLDGLDNQEFWKGYWGNGLVGTALYFLPHLEVMPDRAVAALTAIVSAPCGGGLFHCMGGRDRAGMIALLLLAAAKAEPGEIVGDYMETVRLGEVRGAAAGRNNAEPALEAICRARGTSTEGAVRAVLDGLDLERVLNRGGMSAEAREALTAWRGSISAADSVLRRPEGT